MATEETTPSIEQQQRTDVRPSGPPAPGPDLVFAQVHIGRQSYDLGTGVTIAELTNEDAAEAGKGLTKLLKSLIVERDKANG